MIYLNYTKALLSFIYRWERMKKKASQSLKYRKKKITTWQQTTQKCVLHCKQKYEACHNAIIYATAYGDKFFFHEVMLYHWENNNSFVKSKNNLNIMNIWRMFLWCYIYGSFHKYHIIRPTNCVTIFFLSVGFPLSLYFC